MITWLENHALWDGIYLLVCGDSPVVYAEFSLA